MNFFRLLTFFALVLSSATAFAQAGNAQKSLNFKLELMADNKTWAVYVKPAGIEPSAQTSTGAGQVTLVTPVNFSCGKIENHGGSWEMNARVDGPMEAPGKSYISFGFVTDEPKLSLIPNKESLLFTFQAEDFDGEIYLIDNENDPFAAPNTYGTNPGNDLGIIDFGASNGMQYYAYGKNYSAGASSRAIFASQKESSIASDDRISTETEK